jgi:hypothetical protein
MRRSQPMGRETIQRGTSLSNIFTLSMHRIAILLSTVARDVHSESYSSRLYLWQMCGTRADADSVWGELRYEFG